MAHVGDHGVYKIPYQLGGSKGVTDPVMGQSTRKTPPRFCWCVESLPTAVFYRPGRKFQKVIKTKHEY